MTLEGTRQIIAQGLALVEFGAARRLAVATARSQNRRSRLPSNGELQTTEMMLSYTIGAPSASQMIPPRTNAASTTRAHIMIVLSPREDVRMAQPQLRFNLPGRACAPIRRTAGSFSRRAFGITAPGLEAFPDVTPPGGGGGGGGLGGVGGVWRGECSPVIITHKSATPFAGKLKPNCSRVNYALVVSAESLFEHVAEDAFVGVVIRPNDARRAILGADGRH